MPASDPRSFPTFDIEAAVRAAIDMLATGHPEALALVTADVEMRGPMGEYRGRDQVRSQLSDWHDGLSDIEITIENMAVDGEAVVASWHLSACHTAAVFLMEDMLFEPTGHRVDLDIVTELVFRGRLIRSLRHRFDLDLLLQQLQPDGSG